MLKKSILILLLFSGYTHAYLCRNSFTGQEFKSGTQDLVVFIDSEIKEGENIFANVGDYIECKNEIPNQYVDFLDLQVPNAILPGSATIKTGLAGGVYINNTRFPVGQPNTAFNVFTLTDGDYHPVDIDAYFEVVDSVGPYLEINPGDELMILKLHFHSIPVESQYDYEWRIIAGNRAILATGTCQIDNGQPIEVDFREVGKSKLTTTATSSLNNIRVDKTISFDCEKPNLDMDINISLSATPVSFSSDAFETTISGLGVVMLHNDKVVQPFGKFSSKIIDGKGSENLTFTLVKTPNPSATDLQEGLFTAHGSLILSIQ